MGKNKKVGKVLRCKYRANEFEDGHGLLLLRLNGKLLGFGIKTDDLPLLPILVRCLIETEENMKVSDFAVYVAKAEGKKDEVNIAQIKEILQVSDTLLNGELYKLIRRTKA